MNRLAGIELAGGWSGIGCCNVYGTPSLRLRLRSQGADAGFPGRERSQARGCEGVADVAFIRAKRQGERTYYQLVESRREGTRVRQHVIAYLGLYPSIGEAIAGYSERADRAREEERTWRARAEAERIIVERIRERFSPELVGADIPKLQSRVRPQYWRYQDNADEYGRRAQKLENQAETIRQWCSAQQSPQNQTPLGTTWPKHGADGAVR